MVEVVAKGGNVMARVLTNIIDKMSTAKRVEIGFMFGGDDAQTSGEYEDGTPVAMIAMINEFGQTRIHPHQPPRPFFRNMIAEKQSEWPEAAKLAMKNANYDAKATLRFIGEGIDGQLKDSIDKFLTPALAQATVDKKGFDKPLIDTGLMRKSVTYKVR